MTQRSKRALALIAFGVTGMFFLPSSAQAQFPAVKGEDTAASMGQFMITPDPAWLGQVKNLNCYFPGENLLISPVLRDTSTIVGRSAQILHGDASDTNPAGVQVGSPTGPFVSHSGPGALVVPSSFIEGPTNAQEIHTAIKHLLLTGGGITVTAGYDAAATALGLPLSPGEVEGTSGSPGTFPPGESFFDVFVQVDLPGLGVSVVNNSPLLVSSTGLTSLPPRVIYIHGQSSAVPVVVKGTSTLFGYLRLAGHGMSFNCACDPNNPVLPNHREGCSPPDCNGNPLGNPNADICPDGKLLYDTLNTLKSSPGGLMPCPGCQAAPTIPTIGPAGMIALLLILLAAGTIIIKRRGRGAAST